MSEHVPGVRPISEVIRAGRNTQLFKVWEAARGDAQVVTLDSLKGQSLSQVARLYLGYTSDDNTCGGKPITYTNCASSADGIYLYPSQNNNAFAAKERRGNKDVWKSNQYQGDSLPMIQIMINAQLILDTVYKLMNIDEEFRHAKGYYGHQLGEVELKFRSQLRKTLLLRELSETNDVQELVELYNNSFDNYVRFLTRQNLESVVFPRELPWNLVQLFSQFAPQESQSAQNMRLLGLDAAGYFSVREIVSGSPQSLSGIGSDAPWVAAYLIPPGLTDLVYQSKSSGSTTILPLKPGSTLTHLNDAAPILKEDLIDNLVDQIIP